MNSAAEDALKAAREASTYFEKFDKSNLYHAMAHRENDWLLANQTEPSGVSSKFLDGLEPPDADGKYVVLVPQTGSKPIKLQELHQIVRELVEGIYVFQQLPSVVFEPNHDSSSSCCIPSAYHDTLIGQALFAVNYFVASLLHGTTISQKEKRSKLSDVWKKSSLQNLRSLFISEGMVKMEEDLELGSDLYLQKKEPFWRYPQKSVDCELAKKELTVGLSTGEEHQLQSSYIAHDVFLRCLPNVRIGLVLHVDSIHQDGPLLTFSSGFAVTSSVTSSREEGHRDLFVHLHTYLQKQHDFIAEKLSKHSEVLHYLDLLHVVSFLIPFLVTLRQAKKVVSMASIRPSISKDLLRTDRELPPFFPSKASHWTPYTTENSYGSMFSFVNFHKCCGSVTRCQVDIPDLKSALRAGSLSPTDLLTCTHRDSTLHCLVLPTEEYYSNSPKLPRWLHAMVTELKVQHSHLPSITDSRIQDFLRRSLGPRQAAKMKNANVTLPASVERGLLPCVVALLKRITKTRLNKLDEKGWGLVHYASAHGRADVLSALLLAGCSWSQCCQTPSQLDTCTLPIHLAVQGGDLDTVCCLLRYGASVAEKDDQGWLPLHYAAYHNYQALVGHLVGVAPESLEATTSDKDGATPLLLATMNGGLDSIKTLIGLGANVLAKTKADLNMVHLATVGHHLDILKYLISLGLPALPVWDTLVPMLGSDPSGHPCEAAVRVLDPLTRWRPVHTPLLAHKAIGLLVGLLRVGTGRSQHLAAQVLANISHVKEVGVAIVESDGIIPLINLLKCSNDRTLSCTCLVLCDLGMMPDNHIAIVKSGAASLLIPLLKSDSEEICLLSAACLSIVACDVPENQAAIAECGGVEALMTLLSSPLASIQACAICALHDLLKCHTHNQNKALALDLLSKLLPLLQSKEPSVHCNTASAIEAAVEGNDACQEVYRSNRQCVSSLIRLLRMRDPKVKVHASGALWAIAGTLLSNKQFVATEIGIDLVVDMLGIHNEQLEFVSAQALTALATELGGNQMKIAGMGGIRLLVEALSQPSSQRCSLAVIKTLAALATRPALTPNSTLQESIAVSRGLARLAAMATTGPADDVVQVEAACTMAKLILSHPANEDYLRANTSFSFDQIFRFFNSPDPMVKLMAGYCLAVLTFSGSAQIMDLIRSHGPLDMDIFNFFLQSDNELFQAHAAFQVVVLAKFLSGVSCAEIQVQGIKLLVKLCSSHSEHTKILTSELVAALARCKAGIPDTLVMAGAIDAIIINLQSSSRPVVAGASVALAFLTFNVTASRILVSTFRDNPELYTIFKAQTSTIALSEKFKGTWSDMELQGIPSLSLEVKGGPPVSQGWKMPRFLSQSSTTSGSNSKVAQARSLHRNLSQPAVHHQHNLQPGSLTSRKMATLPKVNNRAIVQQQSLPVQFSYFN